MALLQIVLPQATAYADALLEREGARAFAHVEPVGTKGCVAVHPDDCALCRIVQRTTTATSHGVAPVLLSRLPETAPEGVAGSPGSTWRLRPASRGPPAEVTA